MNLKPGQTPPLVPWALHIGTQPRPYQLPTISRLTLRYQTPTTVRGQRCDHIGAPPTDSTDVSEYQHRACCCPDEASWVQVTATYTAYQQALDALVAALRDLGSYSRRLAEAGGPSNAPNPLAPTVISINDPDGPRNWWFSTMDVPRIGRLAIERHTAKMLREAGDSLARAAQVDRFVCPSDADWERVAALHAAATAAQQAGRDLLKRLGTSAEAKADGRYSGQRPAPPLDQPPAATSAPRLVETWQRAETDLDDALFAQLRDEGWTWHRAKQTPDGRWHHSVQRHGARHQLLRRERLAALVASAPDQVLAVLSPTGESALEGVVMMDAGEAQACVAEIKGHLENARVKLLDLQEREGWKALGYSSWSACVVAEFGQSQEYLSRQLSAAKHERDLAMPIGITLESHLRPLNKLDTPEERREAWERAAEIAGDQPRTAKHVAQAVAEQRVPTRPEPPAGWEWKQVVQGCQLRRIADGEITRNWASPPGAIDEALELDRDRLPRRATAAAAGSAPAAPSIAELLAEGQACLTAGGTLADVLALADGVPRRVRMVVEEALSALHPSERTASLGYHAAHPSALAVWHPSSTNLGITFAEAWQRLAQGDADGARQLAARFAGDVGTLVRACIDGYAALHQAGAAADTAEAEDTGKAGPWEDDEPGVDAEESMPTPTALRLRADLVAGLERHGWADTGRARSVQGIAHFFVRRPDDEVVDLTERGIAAMLERLDGAAPPPLPVPAVAPVASPEALLKAAALNLLIGQLHAQTGRAWDAQVRALDAAGLPSVLTPDAARAVEQLVGTAQAVLPALEALVAPLVAQWLADNAQEEATEVAA